MANHHAAHLEEGALSVKERRQIALEAVKYLTAYGFHPDLAEQAISDLVAEINELGISKLEILEAIQQVRHDRDNGRLGNDPIHDEIKAIFDSNIIPFDPTTSDIAPETCCIHELRR